MKEKENYRKLNESIMSLDELVWELSLMSSSNYKFHIVEVCSKVHSNKNFLVIARY